MPVRWGAGTSDHSDCGMAHRACGVSALKESAPRKPRGPRLAPVAPISAVVLVLLLAPPSTANWPGGAKVFGCVMAGRAPERTTRAETGTPEHAEAMRVEEGAKQKAHGERWCVVMDTTTNSDELPPAACANVAVEKSKGAYVRFVVALRVPTKTTTGTVPKPGGA